MLLQRMHDRQFGGAGIAEQMRDALVLEQCEERRAPGNAIHESPPFPKAVTLGISASCSNLYGRRNGERSWLPCAFEIFSNRVPDAVQRFLAVRRRTRTRIAARLTTNNWPRLSSATLRAALRSRHARPIGRRH